MSSLEGDAKDTLLGFNLTEAQYEQAIKHLKERHDNKEFIIHEYYKTLNSISQCQNKMTELRKNFNHLETQLCSLECIGENIENNHIVALIKSKLPEEMNLKLEETRGEDNWTVENLRKVTSKLILARERSEDKYEKVSSYEYSGESLLGKEVKVRCAYCEKNHWSDECQLYKMVDQRKTRIRGRCFICLSDKHLFRNCHSEKACFYCKRKGNHDSSLCPQKFAEIEEKEVEGDEEAEFSEEVVSVSVDAEVIMKTATVRIENCLNGKKGVANALLDTGAKRTYITLDMAKSLGLKCGPQNVIKLNTFGANKPSEIHTSKTKFSIKQKDGTTKVIQAKVCKTITGALTKQKIDFNKYKRYWKNLDMADNMMDQTRKYSLDILFGNDYYDDIVRSEKIEVDNGLYLINSALGWMFSGRMKGKEEDKDEHFLSMLVDENDNCLEKFWDLEVVGIQNVTEEMEDEEVDTKFKNTLVKIGKRYQVTWPWKLSKYELPDNYMLAEARLKSLTDNLNKDKTLLVAYDEIIKRQMKDGISEEAVTTKVYLQKDSVVTHYLPHHMVTSKDPVNTKLRIVYEGCAKTQQSKKSINDCLYRGRHLVSNLCGVMLRFRLKKIGMIADIEKAHLQLSVDPDERDVTRFLWLKDINLPFSKQNIQKYRFCRVIWGIICSSFLLASTICIHLLQYDTPTSEDIRNNLYVDNLISGAESFNESIEYYGEVKEIFKGAPMNMCKWLSHNKEVMRCIKDEDRCNETKMKVLGMLWDTNFDELLLINVNSTLLKNRKLTKRMMLQIVSSIYDPMGIISPAVIKY